MATKMIPQLQRPSVLSYRDARTVSRNETIGNLVDATAGGWRITRT